MKKLIFTLLLLTALLAIAHRTDLPPGHHGSPYFYPAGEEWRQLAGAAIRFDFCKQHGGYKIILAQGDFHISRPWELFWQQGKDYVTVTYDIQGCGYAMNAQPDHTSNIIPEFTDAPAIIMQNNKGTRIQDITLQGSTTSR